ncbi:hypothetical protein P8452_61265 [Trifolium repens]|nr:hypothetical protein P8452_61265 [Trifolium repens]
MVSLAAVCSGSDLGVGWVVGSPRRKDFAFCLLRLFLFAVVSVCRFQVWVGEGLLVAVILVFFGCWWCLQPDVLLWRLKKVIAQVILESIELVQDIMTSS